MPGSGERDKRKKKAVLPMMMVRVGRQPKTMRKKGPKGRPKLSKDRGIETLTAKQKAVLAAKLEGKSTTAAVEAVYGYKSGPMVKTANALMARKPIIDALESKGVTDEKIAEKIAEGIEANKFVSVGQDKVIETADHIARVQYLKEANKIRDNYPALKIDKSEKIVHITLEGADFRAMAEYQNMRGGGEGEGPVVEGQTVDGGPNGS